MKYLVIEPLNHDQKEYPPGSEVELTEAQAASLQQTNVVGPAIGGETSGRATAADLIAQIAAAETVDAVDAILGTDARATVVAAANKRRTELAA